MQVDQAYIVMGISLVALPYFVWITSSIFAMRIDIALLKKSNGHLARIEKLLREKQ